MKERRKYRSLSIQVLWEGPEKSHGDLLWDMEISGSLGVWEGCNLELEGPEATMSPPFTPSLFGGYAGLQ